MDYKTLLKKKTLKTINKISKKKVLLKIVSQKKYEKKKFSYNNS